jgi:hypothetical protein
MANSLSLFIGPEGTEGVLGLKALERARESGLSDDEIREKIEAEGLKLGEKAKAALSAD